MEAAGKRYIVHPSTKDKFSVWNLADIHYGNRGCNLSKLAQDVKTIRDDPYSFWFGGGDYADYISPKDAKRWSPSTIDQSFTIADLGRLGKAQAERVREILRPISHKCFGLLLGNHEAKYMSHNEQEDLHSWLCMELGVPNLGYCCFCDVVFIRDPRSKAIKFVPFTRPVPDGGFNVRFFLHHGYSGSVSPGGKLNSLIKVMHQFEADVYMMGHVHEKQGHRMTRLSVDNDCKRITQKETVGIITGSYLMTYTQGTSGYGEVKAYTPVSLGASRVVIDPEKRYISGEV